MCAIHASVRVAPVRPGKILQKFHQKLGIISLSQLSLCVEERNPNLSLGKFPLRQQQHQKNHTKIDNWLLTSSQPWRSYQGDEKHKIYKLQNTFVKMQKL